MKKNDFITKVIENGGIETKEKNVFRMSNENYDNLLFDVDGVNITDNGKNHSAKFGNVTVTIITGKTKEKTVTGGNGHKSRNTGYVIMLKNMDEKKPETITNLTTCADIKQWIKTLNRKNVEYLRIYDTMKNECRKSAWIERV